MNYDNRPERQSGRRRVTVRVAEGKKDIGEGERKIEHCGTITEPATYAALIKRERFFVGHL